MNNSDKSVKHQFIDYCTEHLSDEELVQKAIVKCERWQIYTYGNVNWKQYLSEKDFDSALKTIRIYYMESKYHIYNTLNRRLMS